MSWEAINASAQLISSFAVVASLWYLAVQVHRSTRVAKLTAQDAAASALRDVTKQFSENAELGPIWRIGLVDINALSPDDRARFYHVTFQFLKAMETIHLYFQYGLMDEQNWAQLVESIPALSCLPWTGTLLDFATRSLLGAFPSFSQPDRKARQADDGRKFARHISKIAQPCS